MRNFLLPVKAEITKKMFERDFALAPRNQMLHVVGMNTPRDIIRAVGTAEAADRLGVSQSAVRLSVSRGRLPSAWFDILERLCADAGHDCPRSAFAFRQEDAE